MSKTRKLTSAISIIIARVVIVVAAVMTKEAGASNTAWALLAPVIAIALALLTKEVYSSLFIGILAGSLIYSNWNLWDTESVVS